MYKQNRIVNIMIVYICLKQGLSPRF